MKIVFLLFTALFSVLVALAQNGPTEAEKQAAYTKTITTRAEKIVAALEIKNTAKNASVTAMVVAQYRALNDIYTKRDSQIKAARQNGTTDKTTLSATLKNIEDATAEAVASLQQTYLKNLVDELTTAQIEKIKDGMTYGVLPITYNGYLDMLPNLTKEQKAQIMTWLVEARDYAMGAGSSDKKHWWFGKYKGRINNYLSAQGYDLKKESENWHKRIAARESHNAH